MPRTPLGPTDDADPARRVRRQLALTRAGLWAERLVRRFWPAWTVALLAVALWASRLAPPTVEAWALAGLGIAILAALAWGLRGLSAPTAQEARDRLDATLPGRPLQGLGDAQAVGAADPGSSAVWQAHRRRLLARLAGARAIAPDLRVSRADRYALRHVAALLAAVAILFGTVLRAPELPGLPGLGGAAQASGPEWEGWLEPPRHTRLPTLYLAEVPTGPVRVPEGTRVILRLYGAPDAIGVVETVSGRTDADPAAPMQDFAALRSGTLAIEGPGDDPLWSLEVAPDAAPTVALAGDPDFEHPETMVLPWRAGDDYGVTAAGVTFALDARRADRRHGLAVDPEPRGPVALEMPLPIAGDRAEIAETFRFDLTKHPFAGLPVTASLTATDAMGQTGVAEAGIVLPARPFYDANAAALVEQRRDLLWSRDNRARVARVLRAVTWRADDDFANPSAYLLVRMAIRRLDATGDWGADSRDAVAEMLWQAAVRLEENSLDSALERLRQAQERLSEAIRQGADEEEIARLMEEMRRAMDDYTRQLAQQQGEQGQQQQAEGEMQQVTPDMLEQMMERIEELMAEGRTAEAQELLRQLQEMMENLQVTQGQGGQGGQGQQGQGEQAMDDLRDSLREQQDLSDDAFRELQEQFDPGAPGGQPGQRQGQQQGQGEGGEQGSGDPSGQQGQQGGQGQRPGEPGGTSPGELARRQQELRDRIDGLGGQMPGGEAGEAARDALDRAGRAMDEARRDLDGGNLGGALDDQSQAMDALRDGMQELGRALAEDQQDGQGAGGRDQAGLRPGDGSRQDPLGRRSGEGSRLGTDDQFLNGPDAARRSQELMDEIRRRSGERERPDLELDYLRRLLDRF